MYGGARVRIGRTVNGDGIAVVRAEGELDLTSTPAWEHALTSPALPGTPRVVADLTHTTFLDSSAVDALLRAALTVRAAGGWLRVSGAREPVVTVLRIVGLDQVIPVYPTLSLAVRGHAPP